MAHWKLGRLWYFVLFIIFATAGIWGALVPYYYYSTKTPLNSANFCIDGEFYYEKPKRIKRGYKLGVISNSGNKMQFSCTVGFGGSHSCMMRDNYEKLTGKQGRVCWVSIQYHINSYRNYPILISSGGHEYLGPTESIEDMAFAINRAKLNSLVLALIFAFISLSLIVRGCNNA